jgi:outer membrane lipoprotein-sorting protein
MVPVPKQSLGQKAEPFLWKAQSNSGMKAAHLLVASCVAPLLVTSSLQAQTAAEVLLEAYRNTRSTSDVSMVFSSTLVVGPRTITDAAELHIQSDATRIRAELLERQNGNLLHRAVGDGTTRWLYHVGRNEFSNSVYGAYQGAQPADMRSRLFQGLNQGSLGPASTLTRLAQDIFGGDVAQYREWLPLATVTLLQSGSTSDTVRPTRYYNASETQYFIQLTYPANNRRTMVFQVQRNTATDPWYLMAVYGAEDSGAGPTRRELDWQIQLSYPPLPLPAAHFQFIPPTNARPVIAGRPG